ncbi:type II toxin-antitoxin system Phd/YefM family antitoxin [Streptomyces werraensis]|uniref:type II toxin-antitoxin system Phd/YefM family antitoxin n=1 Tax=Streptomyces werraensis TaxID=68284 RepID=UPI0036968E01
MATSDRELRMGVSDARANLTEVIAKVRLLGQCVVLTRREKPQAVLVSHDFYEQALSDRARLESLEK